jgi:hypothetical protein
MSVDCIVADDNPLGFHINKEFGFEVNILYNFFFIYKYNKVFYLNSQGNKCLVDIFSIICLNQEKACNICPFQRFQYFPKS